MELVIILAACFALLFIVEVFLGGALPGADSANFNKPGKMRVRMRMGEFFGHALPLAAAGIGLPMSVQHPWAATLVVGAALMHIFVCRVLKAC